MTLLLKVWWKTSWNSLWGGLLAIQIPQVKSGPGNPSSLRKLGDTLGARYQIFLWSFRAYAGTCVGAEQGSVFPILWNDSRLPAAAGSIFTSSSNVLLQRRDLKSVLFPVSWSHFFLVCFFLSNPYFHLIHTLKILLRKTFDESNTPLWILVRCLFTAKP